jgi:hypothetical protein
MKQINITPGKAIEIDFKTKKVSEVVNTLKPVIFEEDHSYCCLFGPDLKYGIKGFGHTPDEAIEDWEISVRKRIEHPYENDEVVAFIINSLNLNESYNQAS